MKSKRTCVFLVLFLCASVFAAAAPHGRAFWQQIGKNKFAVPPGESADALAHELSALLASPDPELRDDLAYSILARWVYRPNILTTPTLISLTDEWRANLKSNLGETGTNSVLKRSFSALCLSSLAAREAKSPFMGDERYHQLVAEAVSYLQAERDLRGYDPTLHWIHATAHTADLLGALADSALLTREEQAAILAAISNRLSTANVIYTQGEQDRLAAAVIEVIHRKDYDPATFAPWLKQMQDEDADVWTNTTVDKLTRYQNHNYMLQALVVRLSFEPDSPALADFRKQVLAAMRNREE
jgi:uncharacterized protein DUF2785